MIVCPNCTHQNPAGATQCEACYTPLPATTTCPECGTPVQADAAFCGQCGHNLEPAGAPDPLPDIPDLVSPDPLVVPETVISGAQGSTPDPGSPLPPTVMSQPASGFPETSGMPTPPPMPDPVGMPTPPPMPDPMGMPMPPTPPPVVPTNPDPVVAPPIPDPIAPPPPTPVAAPTGTVGHATTQLQQQTCRLLHVQTDLLIELPQNLPVIHMGKPNEQIPPDIDVSGFPDSEIVSRIHADIRVEGDAYYIEDVGSANGTYINHTPLARGNRHRLRPGDRISLGKGDLVTFLFQVA